MLRLLRVLLALIVFPGPLAAQTVEIELVDRTEEAGLDVVTWSGGPTKDHILESAGNGVLVVDYDGDTWPDLYFVNAFRFPERGRNEPHPNALYRNARDGRFEEVAARAGADAAVYGSGGCVGDFDNDGLPDLYVTAFGANILYRNNGDGTFSDVTARAGVGGEAWSTGAVFFDADSDGDQDLYVASYITTDWEEVHSAERTRLWRGQAPVLDGPRGLPGAANVYYRNDGDGTFTEARAEAGLDEGASHYSFGVVATDVDGDADVDLFVANDSQENALYLGRGDGTFEEVATLAGVGYNADGMAQGGMGVASGDADDDGRPELLVTNFANDYYTLYRNLGDGTYIDDSFAAGLALPTFTPLGWGTFFFDVDLDADLDVFFANGHLYAQVDDYPSLHESYRQRNQLFLNEGVRSGDGSRSGGGVRSGGESRSSESSRSGGSGRSGEGNRIAGASGALRFVEARSVGSGLDVEKSSRGAAFVDIDDDGDLDVVVSNQDDRPTLIENRTRTPFHWLGVEFVDPIGDRMALGARVTVSAGGKLQVREVASGGSYMSQSDLRLHLGLGAADRIDELRVRWADGTEDTIEGVSVDAYWRIVRGRPPRKLR